MSKYVLVRRPTIIDVARLASTSKATVARVVNGQHDLVSQATRQRVQQAIDELGYERNAIASSLRTNQTFMIALSIPDIANPFWPEIARGVQDTVEENGYVAVAFNTDWKVDRERKYLKMIRRNRFDGLIINPSGISTDEIANLNIPIVVLGDSRAYPQYDSVGSNTEQGAQTAFSYLYEIGHRRIGLIAGRSARNKIHTRRESYFDFLAKHDIPIDDTLLIESEFSSESGYKGMQKLLNLPHPPTAVLAANDILAISALKAAQDMQCHVPDDVSVIGIDDIYAAATTSPALTTIAKSKYETGTQAARFLLERIMGQAPEQARHVQLPCRLIMRESTAPV